MDKAISAGGIVLNENKVIFVKFPDGKITFPKGTVETGESLEQTALREVGEETGLEGLKIVRKLGMVTRPSVQNNGETVMKDIHLYLMSVSDYKQQKADEETEWLTVEQALPRLFPQEAEFLQNISPLFNQREGTKG